MDMKSSQEEKRKFVRVQIPKLKGGLKLLDPRTWSTYHEKALTDVDNISLGGLSLKTPTEVEKEAPVGLDIKISPEHEAIKVFGRVVWITRENENPNYSVGVRFSWWKKEEDKKIVYDLVQKQIA